LQQDGDYQGRGFIDPPSILKNVEHTSFIPKKLIHTYIGHTKPVQVIKFFPKYGHFILSCSLDNQVKFNILRLTGQTLGCKYSQKMC